MDRQVGIQKIKAIRSWYIFYRVTADVFFAAAIAVVVGSILFYVFKYSALCALPVFALCLTMFLLSRRAWAITSQSISAFLDRTFPALEESSSLVLKSPHELNLLERLQLQHVEAGLQQIPVQHSQFTRRFYLASVLLIGAIALSIMAGKVNLFQYSGRLANGNLITSTGGIKVPEIILPQIRSVKLVIHPPAYTGRGGRDQDKFNLLAEDGSIVTWALETNTGVRQVSLLFNNNEKVRLKSINGDRTDWSISKSITQGGFYQVVIDDKLSELYQVVIIKDEPPVIHIKKPGQYTYIDAGEAQRVLINGLVTDDYGVSNAMIVATVAKGSGEGVKFKEYKIGFSTSFNAHSTQYEVQKLIDLPALGMEPGDELYFYVQATDTHQQQTRTDAYTVSIQDTAQLLSMDGIVTGANLKPEFFRSERQIILDSEHLLKDRDSISKEKFNSRSNDLGVDQKLLRLRYGKFLGEEEESTIGAEAAASSDLSKIENFNNAAMVKDAYTDKHDNAETAGFLEPAIKQQLKATLTEMWKAELQLRLNRPETALAFEYKALRLLKDLQQKSRSYVAKTSYNPPPLKLEKRLSGDLSKITQPVNRQDIKPSNDNNDALKKAVEVLEQLKTGAKINFADIRTLQLADQQLIVKAAAQPGNYLSALNAMRNVLSNSKKVHLTDINKIERAIEKALMPLKPLPQAAGGDADMGLSTSYYKNLKHTSANK